MAIRLIALFLTLFISACGFVGHKEGRQTPGERIFQASMGHVWRAIQLTLKDYPTQVSDLDQGIFETELIKGDKSWFPPHKKKPMFQSGRRYRILIQAIEISSGNRPATKVRIRKEITLQRDFFSSPESIPSDGLEEEAVLYRIGRELQLDQILEKIQNQSSQTQ